MDLSISRSRRNCCVVGCNYTYRNSPPGTKFFSFPNDKQHIIRRKSWITAVRRQTVDGNPWAPTKNARVCSRHFVNGTPTRDPDSPGYVPKLYLKPASSDQLEQKREIAEAARYKRRKLRHGKEIVNNNLVEPCSDDTDIMNAYLMEEITIKEEAVWPKEERNDDDEASAVDGLASSFPLEDIVVKTEPIKVEALESNQDVGDELNSREEKSDGTFVDLHDCRDDSGSSFGVAGQDEYPPSDQDFMCIQCCKRFPSSTLLMQHRSAGQMIYSCKLCKESFCTFIVLSQHMVSHLGTNFVPCRHCDLLFCSNKEYLQHMASHGEDKPFVCPECNKAFRVRGSLSTHLLSHTKEKRHSCRYCNMKFVQMSTLRNHERIHTGEKPFACPECDRLFAHKCNLDHHLLTHSFKRVSKVRNATKRSPSDHPSEDIC